MKVRNTISYILTICLLLLSACGNEGVEKGEDKKITIATAANMQFAMKELCIQFTKQTGIECETIISSSGKLTAQIKQGAPFDMFVSADMKYPNELYQSGFTLEKPQVYAYGKLVLWSMDEEIKPSIELLTDSKLKHIALANPKTAPYGSATVEVLKKYGFYENVQIKLVYGESISQTNQFIISKSAEIGFTSKSVVLSSEMKGKGNWIDIDEADYTAIAQGVVMLKQKNSVNKNSKKFYDFLFSVDARKILEDYGYSVNNSKQ